jgi:rare lipoprotein A
MRILRFFLVAAGLALSACTGMQFPMPEPEAGAPSAAKAEHPVFSQIGIASWYGRGHHGRATANGERFDMNRLTAAHRSLELGTVARVTNLDTGDTVHVRINDRGPYIKGRIIDLSAKAARRLGMREAGLARVRIEVFDQDQAVEAAALD